MSNVFNKLKKLKGRSFDELRVRGSQKLSALAEKRKLTKETRLPSDDEFYNLLDSKIINTNNLTYEKFLEHFRTRTSPKFFKSFHEEEKTKAALSFFDASALIEKAERICNGRFDLLGFKELFFGEPVDWHTDPVSGNRTPLVHWSEIEDVKANDSVDKKIIWELNRCQHFITLGRTFWHTNDECYLKTFEKLIDGWMDENPPKLGVNWLSSLELAFRSISWLWAFYFFKDYLNAEIFSRACKFLYLHARHLEKYLSTYSSPNTHLTGEALGLFYIGLLLPEFKRAEHWRKLGSEILYKELDRHILPDGVYVERTSYYQRYTTDFYLHLLLLSQANDLEIKEKLKTKLQLSLNHLMHITRPDGTTPFYGDDDGGRLMPLDERYANDFRATLATGATAFQKGDYKFVAGEEATEEILWLFGAEGLKDFQNLKAETPKETSIAFPDGGYYMMRDSWAKDANYMLIDCGEHGFMNCGHAHADALSFELAAKGKTLLVDPGTYVYAADIEQRNWFRSSFAHNTLILDGKPSSIPATPFSWEKIANCKTLNWITNDRFDFFAGEHDGYKPAIHVRNVLFVKDNYWIVCDELNPRGAVKALISRAEWNFHFAPNIEKEYIFFPFDNLRTENKADDLKFFNSKGSNGLRKKDIEQVSFCYGSKETAITIKYQARANYFDKFTFVMSHSLLEVRKTDSNKLEIISEKNSDVFLLKGGEENEIESDFEFTWMRYDADGEIEEIILIDGKSFTVRGRNLVSLKESASFAHLKRNGNEFEVITG